MHHHGNLRHALILAGQDLAREEGPEALHLRRITRRVGVSPTAAYRHFPNRSALLTSVADQVQNNMIRQIRHHLLDPDPLRTFYLAYVQYAMTEPGCYKVATLGHHELGLTRPTQHDQPSPLQTMFTKIHDASITSHHEQITWADWAAIHGLADLAADGALHGTNQADIKQLVLNTLGRANQLPPQNAPNAGSNHTVQQRNSEPITR